MKRKFIKLIKDRQVFGYFLIFIAFMSEAFALFVQYGLGYQPCSLCVLIRAGVALMGIAGIIQVAYPDGKTDWLKKAVVFAFSASSIYWILSFTYKGLMIEKGSMIASCSTSSPFPRYLPLDSIFPFIFKPYGVCGISPTIFMNITLMEMSFFGFVLVALYMAIYFALDLFKK